MNEPKLCPLLALADLSSCACKRDCCAWFHLEYHHDGDYTEGECVLLRIADRLGKELTAVVVPRGEKQRKGGN